MIQIKLTKKEIEYLRKCVNLVSNKGLPSRDKETDRSVMTVLTMALGFLDAVEKKMIEVWECGMTTAEILEREG